MSKIKGSNAERDLIKRFWAAGWAAVRSAGSGSMHYPSPDILASNKLKILAIEAKITKDSKKYFSKEEISQLIAFANYFGAEPWISIRFERSSWFFINPEDLKETSKNYVATKSLCESKALSFEQIIKTY